MKKFKLIGTAAMALILAVCMLVGCSQSSSTGGSASAHSKDASTSSSEAKALIIGFDAKYPPYGFIDESGNYTGFDIDLAAATAEANGWTFEAKPIDWDERDAELNSGNITCIWNGFTMEGREGQYAFTEPYMLNEQVIVVKAHSGIDSLDDLAGKKVVTQTSSAAIEALNGPKADLTATFAGGAPLTAEDYDSAFLMLDSNEADAVACDLSIAAYQIAQSGDKYKQIEEPLSTEHYAVGFKLGDEETAKSVTSTLRYLYEKGTVEELCHKYENYGMSFNNWVLR